MILSCCAQVGQLNDYSMLVHPEKVPRILAFVLLSIVSLSTP